MSLRISGGSLRGLKISVPKVQKVRPTSERVREAIFSKIQKEIKEATFLDICSGSGIMSIEAISRGCRFACIVEKHRRCIPIIQENIKKCKICNHQYKIIVGDGKKIISDKSDIVFLDPPYAHDPVVWLFSIESLTKKMLIFEHSSKTVLPDKTDTLEKYDERKYGDTKISYFVPHLNLE
jgi:16S rRNA (guanine(966)-N(2))-methyltransferase RsmD